MSIILLKVGIEIALTITKIDDHDRDLTPTSPPLYALDIINHSFQTHNFLQFSVVPSPPTFRVYVKHGPSHFSPYFIFEYLWFAFCYTIFCPSFAVIKYFLNFVLLDNISIRILMR